MNRLIGWLLAAAALAVGWHLFGWQGFVAALTLVVFWLLLQFNRAIRVMKNAKHAPIGHVPSAVMLNAKLKPGMTMLDILHVTRSLGEQLPDLPDTWRWADSGGSAVIATLGPGGRLQAWHLTRPETAEQSDDPAEASAKP